MKKSRAIGIGFTLSFLTLLSPVMAENTLTVVGFGPVPDVNPSNGTQWNLSSRCADINEVGQAACESVAEGPSYRCGRRNITSCSSKVKLAQRWDGASLVNLSAPTSPVISVPINERYDVQMTINNHGAIASDRVIYEIPGSPNIKSNNVRWINDSGEYVVERRGSSGGIPFYTSNAYNADGTEQPQAGAFARPMVISNNQHMIGAQILQSFVQDTSSSDEIAEVSGIGWLLDQTQIDNLKRNELGNIDDDGYLLYPVRFVRPMAYTSTYYSNVYDVNDFGEFVSKTNFGGLYSGKLCDPKSSSVVSDYWGGLHTVPWKCTSTNYHGGTSAGGKAYLGLNNIGDAVGVFTPGVSGWQFYYPQIPLIWLKTSLNRWREFDANDLLPAGTDYTILKVKDINTRRQVVGTCQHNTTEVQVGCILNLSDHPVPKALKKPVISIESPAKGSTVSGAVAIDANAFDRDGFVAKVIFKVGNKVIGTDKNAPYTAIWDTEAFARGLHDIKVIAVDNENNRRGYKSQLTVGTVAPPEPPVTGTPIEGEGAITAVHSALSIEIDGESLSISDATVVKFNDVSDFAIGLAIQYKGVMTTAGVIEASVIEVN